MSSAPWLSGIVADTGSLTVLRGARVQLLLRPAFKVSIHSFNVTTPELRVDTDGMASIDPFFLATGIAFWLIFR